MTYTFLHNGHVFTIYLIDDIIQVHVAIYVDTELVLRFKYDGSEEELIRILKINPNDILEIKELVMQYS